ncbi:protein FAR1-RELATED SEQUENCE 5-like [Triticum dicoccoides]|uniref:protein FAR1-RELATED SEQUENCE 5-like n=1 Tax=Triticum dicoccoides TaxID=85692 RepID=UPI00188E4663|nr:protein FAR1-RELATED SEQUENCE 5-like [Triticum dicoccoides]
MSKKDSDDELTENEAKPEEYLFPTPDEMENTSTPEVGKVFSSLEEAVRFVNIYAHIETGNTIKKGRNYRNRKITICCCKSRKTEPNAAGVRKRRRNVVVRTNCQMHVTVSLQDGKWIITSQDLEHNHDLVCSPTLTKFFLSHRSMNEAEKLLSRLLQEHRIKPRKIMSIFRKLSGGKLGNITFDVKKLDNLKQEDREKRRNTDIEHTLEYIEKLQIDKPGFVYKAQRNASNSVLSLFWTDSRSRLDYLLFGDIISFDTRFSTNKYNMPFAPIIGVNGHSRTIVFGWALLQNEQVDTFKWLFETFVEVMGGKKPRVVLTDQDAAMKKAVPKVFPDALHRFCIWHVRRKARENLGAYMSINKGMEQDLDYCIMQSMTVEEFEMNWKEMELKHSCGKHAHIKCMWENREYFVPAYFQGVFCPFIRSTSRSESFNSNFKDYVLRKDTIETFLRQYELFQENVMHIEDQDRFLSNEEVPIMWGYQRVERHAAEIYTRAIYTKFLTEMFNSTAFGVNEIVKNESYELKRNFPYENP